jgi:hypothetical protein
MCCNREMVNLVVSRQNWETKRLLNLLNIRINRNKKQNVFLKTYGRSIIRGRPINRVQVSQNPKDVPWVHVYVSKCSNDPKDSPCIHVWISKYSSDPKDCMSMCVYECPCVCPNITVIQRMFHESMCISKYSMCMSKCSNNPKDVPWVHVCVQIFHVYVQMFNDPKDVPCPSIPMIQRLYHKSYVYVQVFQWSKECAMCPCVCMSKYSILYVQLLEAATSE